MLLFYKVLFGFCAVLSVTGYSDQETTVWMPNNVGLDGSDRRRQVRLEIYFGDRTLVSLTSREVRKPEEAARV